MRFKKATEEHLSNYGGRFFRDNTYNADHAADIFKMTVNDPAERYFFAMSGQLQYYCKIGLTNTRGINRVIVNGDLLHGFDTVCKKKYRTGGENIS